MPRTPKPEIVAAPESIEAAQPITPTPLSITFDLYQMTVDDLSVVHAMRRGQASDEAVVELFNRVVVGGAKVIPYPALREACKAFYRAVFNISEPETPQGN